MTRQCKQCNKTFTISVYKKKYCSILCAKNAHDLQKYQYKQRNKHEIELRDIKRKKAVAATLKKNAANRCKPYSKKDDKLIMSKIGDKYEYGSTMLAYILKRTKPSVEQRRGYLKKLKEGILKKKYRYLVLIEESCSAVIQYDLAIEADSIGHARQMVQDAFDHKEDVYNLGEVVKETIINTSESDPLSYENVTDIRYYHRKGK